MYDKDQKLILREMRRKLNNVLWVDWLNNPVSKGFSGKTDKVA